MLPLLLWMGCEPVSFGEREILFAVPSTPTPVPTSTPKHRKKKKADLRVISTSEIREAYAGLLTLAMEHDLLEGDLSTVDAEAKGLKKAVESAPTQALLKRIYLIQAAIPRFELTREFLKKKSRRIHRQLEKLDVGREKVDVVEDLFTKVNEFVAQENFLDANRLLNGIHRDIQMLQALRPEPAAASPTPDLTPEPTPGPESSSVE